MLFSLDARRLSHYSPPNIHPGPHPDRAGGSTDWWITAWNICPYPGRISIARCRREEACPSSRCSEGFARRWRRRSQRCCVWPDPRCTRRRPAPPCPARSSDSQGGVLPGATVTLTSRTQGNTLYTATTDDEGRFVFAIVRPDTYMLKVTMQGFKTAGADQRGRERERPRLDRRTSRSRSAGSTENVTVESRVSELQMESGERSFTLENEALTNIANNGRALFNFANLVPGVRPATSARASRTAQVSGFTVNGQRPNSNNMTIDGVANIDTGDNGGNMATTNIDAVAEFKILTNAYQAEYGRAVGGQIQVVTKSGTQEFHGSGYWYGRRSDWNANSWTNKRAAAPPPVGNGRLIEKPESSRNDYGYTLGGPVFIPGVFNEDKKKLFFFWSQEFQSRSDPADRAAGPGAHGARAPRGLLPERGQQREPLPVHPRLPDRAALQRRRHARLLPGRRRARPDPPEPPLRARPQRPEHLPRRRTSPRAAASTSRARSRTRRPRREDLLRLDFQATDKWRFTGRYMNTKEEILQAYGTTWAGNGSDQLPMPDPLPAPGQELHALGHRHPQPHDVARGQPGARRELAQLRAAAREPVPLGGRPLRAAPALPRRRPGGLHPLVRVPRRPHGQRRPVPDRPRSVHQREHHPRRAGQPVQGLGLALDASSASTTRHSYKPQSIFASFNSRINFVDDANNPFDTGLRLRQRGHRRVQHLHPGQQVRAAGVGLQELRVVRPGQLEGQPQAHARLRRALLLPDPAVGPDAAGLELPARAVRRRARRRGCTARSASAPLPAPAPTGAAWTRRSFGRRRRPPLGNTVEERFIGRLVPGSNRFNGAFQAGQGDRRRRCRTATRSGSRRGSASPTTSPATSRRSCAAASGSSTTGRRATRCST